MSKQEGLAVKTTRKILKETDISVVSGDQKKALEEAKKVQRRIG